MPMCKGSNGVEICLQTAVLTHSESGQGVG